MCSYSILLPARTTSTSSASRYWLKSPFHFIALLQIIIVRVTIQRIIANWTRCTERSVCIRCMAAGRRHIRRGCGGAVGGGGGRFDRRIKVLECRILDTFIDAIRCIYTRIAGKVAVHIRRHAQAAIVNGRVAFRRVDRIDVDGRGLEAVAAHHPGARVVVGQIGRAENDLRVRHGPGGVLAGAERIFGGFAARRRRGRRSGLPLGVCRLARRVIAATARTGDGCGRNGGHRALRSRQAGRVAAIVGCGRCGRRWLRISAERRCCGGGRRWRRFCSSRFCRLVRLRVGERFIFVKWIDTFRRS